MFVESVELWGKGELPERKMQKLYNSDQNSGWHGKEKYIHLLNYGRHHLDDSVSAGRQEFSVVHSVE